MQGRRKLKNKTKNLPGTKKGNFIIVRIEYYRLKKFQRTKTELLEIKDMIWKNLIEKFEGKIKKFSQKGQK